MNVTHSKKTSYEDVLRKHSMKTFYEDVQLDLQETRERIFTLSVEDMHLDMQAILCHDLQKNWVQVLGVKLDLCFRHAAGFAGHASSQFAEISGKKMRYMFSRIAGKRHIMDICIEKQLDVSRKWAKCSALGNYIRRSVKLCLMTIIVDM